MNAHIKRTYFEALTRSAICCDKFHSAQLTNKERVQLIAEWDKWKTLKEDCGKALEGDLR